MMDLKQFLKTTPRYIDLLKQNGITTLKQFFEYFPKGYEDRSTIIPLSKIVEEGKVISSKILITEKKIIQRPGKKIFEIHFHDEYDNRGSAQRFGNTYLSTSLQSNKRYILTGKPKLGNGKIIFWHPEMTPTEESDKEVVVHNAGRIYPVYSEMLGIKPGRFSKKIRENLDAIPRFFSEYLPAEFLSTFDLMDVPTTIREMHYPTDFATQKKALQRVFYDRLLRIQLYSIIVKQEYQHLTHNVEPLVDRSIIKDIISKLPFELTNAQKKAIKTIIEEFHQPKPMMRLMQGDVGSGKTIVAAIASYYMLKKFGGQSVFLAPIQVLAHQHYQSLAKILLPLGVRLQYIAGSLTPSIKKKIKSDLKHGLIDIIVGTQALLQEDIEFHNLVFAVIDEQHKFGVKQRSFFKKFGNPHILQMTATPIPRSLALAFFGEFDVTLIDELPKGRKPIITKIISEHERIKLKPRILSKIALGQKVFVITPLIEESEKIDNLKAATVEYQEITELYTELKEEIGLLHGKCKPKEKDMIMAHFKSGKIKILVSTTVIEVGVDVPEATIMIIKNAERFGLSQLHQLRGRVGRSDIQSYCFLETKYKSGDSYKRLKAMEETNDGFKLAEIDLSYRGAGEILGTRQSGQTDIPIEIITDIAFLEKVQQGAIRLLKHYPNLDGIPPLKHQINEKLGNIFA